jgi:hypothetical protein
MFADQSSNRCAGFEAAFCYSEDASVDSAGSRLFIAVNIESDRPDSANSKMQANTEYPSERPDETVALC